MTFEEYLQEQFFKLKPPVLDDDMSDAFDNWLEQLDGQEYMDYVEEWGKKLLNYMKCNYCKKRNKKDYIYCRYCGRRSPYMQKLVDKATKKSNN